MHGPQPQDDAKRITVAVDQAKSATVKLSYGCRIESHRRIEVCNEADVQLAAIAVKEGQEVERGDLLFEVRPPVDQKNPEAENRDKTVFIKATFDGIVGPLPRQRGSVVRKYETLTTLSDSSKMSVYFDMPEKHFLEYFTDTAKRGEDWRSLDLELILADHSKFPHVGKIIEVLGSFHNETGDITFRGIPEPGRAAAPRSDRNTVGFASVIRYLPYPAMFHRFIAVGRAVELRR